MRKIFFVDAWLIENIFQPVCNLMSNVISCFSISKLCILLSAALFVVHRRILLLGYMGWSVSERLDWIITTSLVIASMIFLFTSIQILENRTRPNFTNPLRILPFAILIRLTYFLFLIVYYFYYPVDSWSECIEQLSALFTSFSAYFCACDPVSPSGFSRASRRSRVGSLHRVAKV